MAAEEKDNLREEVRNHYAEIARGGGCCRRSSCCGDGSPSSRAAALGYTNDDARSAPEGAFMGLGCGNPVGAAKLRPGEVVLDLGSGPGFDCFLAAKQVGPEGEVIGVDMTPEMISHARKAGAEFSNVEFRLGEIENIPAADNSVDVVMSNCVINLSTEKERVYRGVYRVLKPGGRLVVSDVVALRPLPEEIRRDVALYAGCVAGAAQVDEIAQMLDRAGFEDVEVKPNDCGDGWKPVGGLDKFVASAMIRARKPD